MMFDPQVPVQSLDNLVLEEIYPEEVDTVPSPPSQDCSVQKAPLSEDQPIRD